MPEYDAFGREIGDDPLAALREATVAEPAPVKPGAEVTAAEPVVAPVAGPEAAPVSARPQFVRPRRRRRRVFAPLLVLGTLIAAVGMFANVAVNEIERGLDDLVEIEEATGLAPASMLRAPNLDAALAQLRGSGLGRPLTLRVGPNRVEARLVAGNGRQSLVHVTARHELRIVGVRAGGRPRAGIPYGRIDATVPERLARAGADKGRRIRFARLDRYGWRAYFRDGSVARGG